MSEARDLFGTTVPSGSPHRGGARPLASLPSPASTTPPAAPASAPDGEVWESFGLTREVWFATIEKIERTPRVSGARHTAWMVAVEPPEVVEARRRAWAAQRRDLSAYVSPLDACAADAQAVGDALVEPVDAPSAPLPEVVTGPAETPNAEEPVEAVGDAQAVGELVAYTDGSGTQAHLPSGAGVVVYDRGVVVLEASRYLGCGTNNHAELSATRIALAITDTPAWRERPLLIRSDSQYAIRCVTSQWPPREGAANERLINIIRRQLLARPGVSFEWVPGHAGVEGNERADALAGMARLRPTTSERRPG